MYFSIPGVLFVGTFCTLYHTPFVTEHNTMRRYEQENKDIFNETYWSLSPSLPRSPQSRITISLNYCHCSPPHPRYSAHRHFPKCPLKPSPPTCLDSYSADQTRSFARPALQASSCPPQAQTGMESRCGGPQAWVEWLPLGWRRSVMTVGCWRGRGRGFCPRQVERQISAVGRIAGVGMLERHW